MVSVGQNLWIFVFFQVKRTNRCGIWLCMVSVFFDTPSGRLVYHPKRCKTALAALPNCDLRFPEMYKLATGRWGMTEDDRQAIDGRLKVSLTKAIWVEVCYFDGSCGRFLWELLEWWVRAFENWMPCTVWSMVRCQLKSWMPRKSEKSGAGPAVSSAKKASTGWGRASCNLLGTEEQLWSKSLGNTKHLSRWWTVRLWQEFFMPALRWEIGRWNPLASTCYWTYRA